MIQVKNTGQELEIVRSGVSTYYHYSSFKTISWFQANNGNYIVVINFLTDAGGNIPLRISLNEVSNQPSWTNNAIGAANAAKDISNYSGATIENIEALVASMNGTLTAILATLQNGDDWEAFIVKDSDTPPVIWLEIRTWDSTTSTWSIQYFLPGSTIPGSPVLPVVYESPNSLLALILAELIAQTASLSNIDSTTSSILTELQGTIDVLVTNGAGASAVNIQDGGNAITVDDGGGSLTVDGTVTANQGTNPWVVSGTVNIGTIPEVEIKNDSGNPIPVSDAGGSLTVDGTVALDAPTLSALENITVQNGAGAAAVNIQDGGNSITVDGTVGLDAPTLSALENITVQNPGGASAVNIQDGGNSITVDDGGGSITVDGTVTAIPSGTQDVNIVSGITLEVNLDQNNDQVQVYGSDLTAPIATNSLGRLQVDIVNAPEIEIKNDAGNPVPISDAGGSLTVDGTVALDAGTLSALENITVQNGAGAAAVNIQDGGNSITVDGSVSVSNFPASIEISNDSGNPLPVSGTVTANQGTSPWVVSGTVTATPTGTQDVNIVSGVTLEVNLDQNNDQVQVYGSDLTAAIATDTAGHLQVDILTIPEVEIKNDAGNPVPVNGTVNVTDGGGSLTVDGTVNIGNFPASIEISNDSGNPLPVSGTVTITDGSGPVTVDGTVAATQSGTWNINNITGTVSLPTGAATESTLSTLNSQFTAVTRTPALIRATGSGTIAAGARSISVFNAGAAAGSILGVAGNILPGEAFEFSAGGENDTLAAFAYNGTGTTLVITSIV